MALPVVIDVGVAEPPRELATALVEACTRAAAETKCYLVREAPEGPYAAIAIVTWEAPDRARIEVGLRRESSAEWRTRQLSFQTGDVELERYRSVGFVIGILATGAPDPASADPPPEPPEPAPAVSPPAPPLPQPKSTPAPAPTPSSPPAARGFVGLTGTLGTAADTGPARYGANLRAGVRVLERFAVMLSAGVSTRPRDANGVLLEWLDAGIGASAGLGAVNAPHVELRAELVAEHFSAEARTAAGFDTRSRTIPAARVGADGVLMFGHMVGIVAGAELLLRPSITRIRVQARRLGRTNAVELGGVAGLRLEL